MELFRTDGCLSDEGLQALTEHKLDELGRLEASEHLSYCDRCLDRYTALLTGSRLETPPQDLRRPVMNRVWGQVMQNVYGRAMVAGIAAVLALTIWGGGMRDVILHRDSAQGHLPHTPLLEAGESYGHGPVSKAYDQLFEAWEGLMLPDRQTNDLRN